MKKIIARILIMTVFCSITFTGLVKAETVIRYNPVAVPYSTTDSFSSEDGLSFNETYGKGYSFIGRAGEQIIINIPIFF